MAFAMSDYLEGQVIAHLFRTATFTKPPALYIALFTVTPSDSGGGTEVTGGSYARVARAPLDANWAAPTGGNGTTSNVAAVTFPTPTANWGTIVAIGIFDASTSGNLLLWGPLVTSKTVNNGDAAPSFGAGSLAVAFD
jgi:hypothetical protein